MVFVHFPADDGFGSSGFAAAIGEVGSGHLLKIVDVVDEAAFDFVHARVDVARNGDVDEEHRAVAPSMEEVLTVGATEDFLRGPGGGDDNVGARRLGVEVVEGDRFGMDGGSGEVRGNLFGARPGTVGDEDGGGAVFDEVARSQLRHLPGAYKQDSLSLKRAKDFSGEVDGNGGDRDTARGDLRFAADFFGYSEGALQERLEVGGDGADFARDTVGLFDLAEDLGFANDHAVEGTGDAEEMADGFAVAVFVEVGLDVVGRDREIFVEKPQEVGFSLRRRGFAVVLEGEQFDAVAGGEDEAFANAWLVEEGAGGVGQAGGGDGEALADLDRCGVVVDAEQDETSLRDGGLGRAHGAVNLWTEEN